MNQRDIEICHIKSELPHEPNRYRNNIKSELPHEPKRYRNMSY